MVQGFLVTIWTGGGRFAHTATGQVWTLRSFIFGLSHMASVSTFTRSFGGLAPKRSKGFSHLSQWMWKRVKGGNWTWGFERADCYGEQEGRNWVTTLRRARSLTIR